MARPITKIVEQFEVEFHRAYKAKAQLVKQTIDAILDRAGMTLDEVYEVAKGQVAAARKAMREDDSAAPSAPAKGRGRGKAKTARASKTGGKTRTPKYRDPVSGKTWTGAGSQPVWLRSALEGGASIDDFRIAGAGGDAAPSKAGKKTAGRKAAKGASRGKAAKKATSKGASKRGRGRKAGKTITPTSA